MIRLSLLMLLCLLFIPSAWGETLVLDSSDIQDWVRVPDYNAGKYQDTMMGVNALLKFQTHELPEGAIIQSATLNYRQLKCASGETINVYYVRNDEWSYDMTTAGDLHAWPHEDLIGSYAPG